ncbi:carbohydrate binding family 9 domain-containing protein, partial [Gemmatimonadota bacterium]
MITARTKSSPAWSGRILSSLLLLAAWFQVSSAEASRQSVENTPGADLVIRVVTVDQPVKIDGQLDDEAWTLAETWRGRFFQQEPLDREPSTQETELRVLQDKRNIYIGAVCHETDPSKILATVKIRDGRFLSDDALEFLIDTFQDKRNMYAFGTNPFGAKVDAIISDEGNHINKGWDCVWQCKVTVGERGWVVEMAIPFKSIKYKPGTETDWGINIAREIKHSKEVTYLAPIPRSLGHNGKFKASLFVSLSGIRPPEPSLNLEVQPHIIAGRTSLGELGTTTNELDAGVDVRYHLTSQFALDLTYKTDFAQAESDDEIVNVSRFNINRREKREFFNQSAGIFNFGSGMSAGGTLVGRRRDRDEYKLFESRTIGIVDEQKVPMLGGIKLAGKAGDYSLGLMNLQTEAADLEDDVHIPSSNYTAFKIKRNLLTNSYVGLMALNRQSAAENFNRALGGEAFLALSPEFSLNGTLARTFTPADSAQGGWGGDLGVVLNKDWLEISARYSHLDSLFNPAMGFVRRENIRSYDTGLALTKWINNRHLKKASFFYQMDYKTDHHSTMLFRENKYNFYLTTASDDMFYYSIHPLYEFLPEDDEILDVPISAGIYDGVHQMVMFRSYMGRKISGSVSYRWGDRLSGTSSTLTVRSNFQWGDNLHVDLDYKNDELDLPTGKVCANTVATRLIYSFSTELFAKYYLQYNSADERISSNLLIDYIFKPRCHLYLVYNEGRDSSNDLVGTY